MMCECEFVKPSARLRSSKANQRNSNFSDAFSTLTDLDADDFVDGLFVEESPCL